MKSPRGLSSAASRSDPRRRPVAADEPEDRALHHDEIFGALLLGEGAEDEALVAWAGAES